MAFSLEYNTCIKKLDEDSNLPVIAQPKTTITSISPSMNVHQQYVALADYDGTQYRYF
jgi:hypothetical protein